MNYHSSDVSIEIWGSNKPKQDLFWSEGMVEACVFLMDNINFQDTKKTNSEDIEIKEEYKVINNTHFNIGTGKDISIKKLAQLVKEHIGFKEKMMFNTNKPNGKKQKLNDPGKFHELGWRHQIDEKEGISMFYEWYTKTC